MSDFQGRESFIIEQAFDATSTTNKQGLGTIVRAFDTASTAQGQGEFIYLEGVGSTVLGDWVHYDPDTWKGALSTAGTHGPMAVAMSANTASQYGWYQISGKAVGRVLTGYADNGLVVLTGTSGRVDDQSVAGDNVHNAKGASATTAGTLVADFEIWRPYSDNGIRITASV